MGEAVLTSTHILHSIFVSKNKKHRYTPVVFLLRLIWKRNSAPFPLSEVSFFPNSDLKFPIGKWRIFYMEVLSFLGFDGCQTVKRSER